MYTSFKLIGYVVILAMLGALAFAGYLAVVHWNGIGV
jgi:hypothetical protein